MTRTQRLVGYLVTALAGGATVATAYLSAASQEGVTVEEAQAEVRGAILESAGTLRTMGRSEAEIVTAIAARTSSTPEDVAPVVHEAFSNPRPPETIRSVEAVIAVSIDHAAPTWQAIGEAHCAPLRLADAETDLYAECMTANAVEQGAARCDAQGQPVGWVVRSPVTPAHYARLQGLTLEEPAGWEACPDVAP
jgi:hypothetical protein